MRAAIGLRLILVLTLLGWGQFGVASTLAYWTSDVKPGSRYSAALEACKASHGFAASYLQGSIPIVSCHGANQLGDAGPFITFVRQVIETCPYGHTDLACNNSCNAPNQMVDGQCVIPPEPKDCSSKSQIYSAQVCVYVPAIKNFVCPDSVNFNGCEYVSSPSGSSNCDISTSICVNRFSPTGSEASAGSSDCSPGSCSPVPLPSDPGPAPDGCVTNGNSTYCYQDKDSGCGTFNGKEGCFETESGCGTFNGVWGCYPIDKEQRNCGYAAGEQVCFDPKNPTVQIPTSSPDHPKNGGNADGNDKNDPKAPGGSGSSPQGGDEGATNEAIDQLGDDLGAKIDKTNSLLGGITDILDGIAEGLTELTEGLLGDDYDGSGDGDSGELAGIGEGAGSELAQMFSQQLTDAEEQELAQDESYLDQIASDVDHPSFLGEDSRFAQLLEFADDLLPSHTGCVDYSVPLELGRYKSTITLPVCRIATLRPLLEYIIYIITAIGLWNIAYSTLRMENAKAAKGGF